MLHGHFESLRPLCPRCRPQGHDIALAINIIETERAPDDIVAGIVGCNHCGAEYPVIDGLPILVADPRQYIQDNLFGLLARDDLPPLLESLVGDAVGPGTLFDATRQHLSSYAWDHWAEFDPEEPPPTPDGPRPGAIARGLAQILTLADAALPPGPILDIGCGAGRAVHELAAAGNRLVLGIDLGFSLAQTARRAIVNASIRYPRRRIGLVFDQRRFAAPPTSAGMADVWVCDATALPFADATFARAFGMNVLDCLGDPRAGLIEIDRILATDGEALLAVPFDWSAAATPIENWLGGHSQRGPHGGNAEAILDLLLSAGPLAVGTLRRKSATVDIPWHVRLHERACMHYHAHGIAACRHEAIADDRHG